MPIAGLYKTDHELIRRSKGQRGKSNSALAKQNRLLRDQKRSFLAAQQSRLFRDWPTSGGSAGSEIYAALEPFRVRARHLAKNNDYAKRFLGLLKQNVVGPEGVRLQSRAKNERGELDKADNEYLETEFKRWGKKGVCTVCGGYSFVDVENMFLETMARDGEFVARKVYPWPGNRFGFALQLLEPDSLDHELNKVLPNGNKIRMGIEFNSWNRPVAYYFVRQPRNRAFWDDMNMTRFTEDHERIPAEFILHEFIRYRIGQSRGFPWFHTSGRRLHQLGGYEEAELVAARTAASKMGFFKSPTGDEYTGDDDDDDEPTKTPTMVADPGTFEELPEGMDFVAWNPEHPTTAYEAFVLSTLRGIASGLNVSYVNLANDLRSVSYSSIRQGELTERDAWRAIQGFLIEHFVAPVYETWLKMGITIGDLNLPAAKMNKFLNYKFQARGWKWVDPLKEVQASENEVRNGFKSPQMIAAENGRDFNDVLRDIAKAKEMAEEYGLTLDIFTEGGSNAAKTQETLKNDPDEKVS